MKTIYQINGTDYVKSIGLGCQLESREYGCKYGEVRLIGKDLFYVWSMETYIFKTPIVKWASVELHTNPLIVNSVEFVRQLHARLESA